ncbi:cytoskeleton protein RodZ [Streptococcus ovis]|uniref:cytoskeleton protein RodZ n=1 Tax=Streptococcus ovis TaxID=82806 RepID=UPI0004779B12|nr:cytoskeleton protein RodZ [Streptococcus ovis]
MRQKSIGEVLRDARENRGWNLSEVQRMIGVQTKYLQALEYNDFEAIPDKTYTRSFLQRYAEVLELDAAVLLDAYDTNRLVVYYEVGEEPDFELDSRRAGKGKKQKKSYLPLIYLLLAAILILVFVTYIVAERIQNQAIPTPSSSYSVVKSSTESSTTPETTVSSTTTPSSVEEPATALAVTGGGENLAVTVSGAADPIEIVFSVTDVTSWISLTDTDIAGGATLSPENNKVTVTIPEGVTSSTLTLGVVKGVAVTVAGKELDTSPLTSQTGYITFTFE